VRSGLTWSVRTRSTKCCWTFGLVWSVRSTRTGACWRARTASEYGCMTFPWGELFSWRELIYPFALLPGDIQRKGPSLTVFLVSSCVLNSLYPNFLQSFPVSRLPCNPCATTNACDKPIGPCVPNPCVTRPRCGPCNTFVR
jgi:hypothetical protein